MSKPLQLRAFNWSPITALLWPQSQRQCIAAGAAHGEVSLWDLSGQRLIWSTPTHPYGVFRMTGVSTNAGELLVCGGVGGELVALSVADGQPVARTSAGANVLSIATVEPSQDVVVGRDDGSVELWTTSTWTRRWHHDAEAGAYAVGAIGQKLVAQTYDDRVLVLDGDGTLFATIEGAGSILVPFGDGLLVRNGDRLEMRALTGGLIHSWRDPLAHRVEQVGRDRWVVSSWRKRVGTMRIMDGSWRRVATSPIHSRLPFKSHVRWCDAIVGGTADGVLIVWKPWNRSKALPDDSNECSF